VTGTKTILKLTGPIGGATLALLAACGPTDHPGTAVAPAVARDAPRAPYRVAMPVPSPVYLVNHPPERLQLAIAQLHRRFVGTSGIAVRAVDAGWTVEAGGRQRLPQQSVSKLWVAITVLDQLDAGRLSLATPVLVRPQDLTLFHQPIAALVAKSGGYQTTVGDLLDRALTHSDNTANDRLLHLVGGPGVVRSTMLGKQLGDIRFGPGERALQSGTAGLTWQPSYAVGNSFEIARSHLSMDRRVAALDSYLADPPDGAAPLAIADALARLARGELLSPASTAYLLRTMGNSVTGRARLRAALPAGWQIAHKTGTGQDLGARSAGFNDVGLLTAPDGTRFAIAVMIGDTTRPMRERQELIQAVASAVTEYEAGHGGGSEAAN